MSPTCMFKKTSNMVLTCKLMEASVDLNGVNGVEGNGRFPEVAEWPESGSYADLG